jgi:hypothetical protein
LTTFFPWLVTGKRPSHPIDGVYAGAEAVFWKNPRPCTSSLSVPGHRMKNAKISASATVTFDRGTFLSFWNSHRRIKVYSATLTLEPLQTVSLSSGKVTLSHGRWCGKGGVRGMGNMGGYLPWFSCAGVRKFRKRYRRCAAVGLVRHVRHKSVRGRRRISRHALSTLLCRRARSVVSEWVLWLPHKILHAFVATRIFLSAGALEEGAMTGRCYLVPPVG